MVSIATAGDLLQWHPHLHLITTDAGRTSEGSWRKPGWDAERPMRLFRERLLARLVEKRAISTELVAKLLTWRHPGFSPHVGESIAPDDKQRLSDTAAYVVRNPLSLQKLVVPGRPAGRAPPLQAESVPEAIGSEAPATRTTLRRKLGRHPSRENVAHPAGRG